MIKIDNVEVVGIEHAIRGMRNPMNSWEKSDSGICKGGDNGIGCDNCAGYDCGHTYDRSFQLGKADYELMTKLAAGGPVHAKYRRMITVYLDITAPLYWWKEFDTYKVGTVANSCSTMHKIHAKEFELDDFSHEHLMNYPGYKTDGLCVAMFDCVLQDIIKALNWARKLYLDTGDKQYWWQMIQLLPSSYNQKRTVMLNYEVLAHIYQDRKSHKLDEWCEHPVHNTPGTKDSGLCFSFCDWIRTLPFSDLIMGTEVVEAYCDGKLVATFPIKKNEIRGLDGTVYYQDKDKQGWKGSEEK